MKIQITKTTDGKNEGLIVELPALTYETIDAFGMDADRIDTEKCIVQNSNYTIHYKIIEE